MVVNTFISKLPHNRKKIKLAKRMKYTAPRLDTDFGL